VRGKNPKIGHSGEIRADEILTTLKTKFSPKKRANESANWRTAVK
jgi:hypothetical protein